MTLNINAIAKRQKETSDRVATYHMRVTVQLRHLVWSYVILFVVVSWAFTFGNVPNDSAAKGKESTPTSLVDSTKPAAGVPASK